ncbi:MAG: flagellar hook-length control protein FliK, partial [bacterium]
KHSQGQVRVELSTESLAARDWLMQQLSESEIKVDEIKVLNEKPELKEGQGKQKGQNLTSCTQNSKPRLNFVPGQMKNYSKKTKPIHNTHVNRRVQVSSKDTPPLAEDVDSFQKVIREEILEGINGEDFSKNISKSHLALKKNMDQNLNNLNLAKIHNLNFIFSGNKLINFGRLERSTFPEMMQKIIEMTKAHSHSAGQKLAIQMDVESLGSLLVDAFKQKDKIHIQINVENSEVRRLLENQLRPLLNQFMKDGIEIGKLEVSVRDQNPENQSGGKAGQNELNFFETSNKLSSQTRTEFIEDAMPAQPGQRDFGYNSIEIWA